MCLSELTVILFHYVTHCAGIDEACAADPCRFQGVFLCPRYINVSFLSIQTWLISGFSRLTVKVKRCM
jgi:hypothetical protein